MENTLMNRYKNLLKKCLDKGISLNTIQQIIFLSQLKSKKRAIEELEKIVDIASENQIKVKIAQLIEETQ